MTLLLLLLLLLSGGLAAPRTGDRLEVPEDVLNPFTLGPEQLSLLQGCLQDEDPMEEKPFDMKRESVIVHLFVLYDVDKNGLLDGLELMRLLRRMLTKNLPTEPTQEEVISLVDDILVSHDLSQDGLLSAQELVTPPASKPDDFPPVNVSNPVPPGSDTSQAPPTTQSKDNDPTPEQAETSQEEPAGANHEAPSLEGTNGSEETEEGGEKQVIQEGGGAEEGGEKQVIQEGGGAEEGGEKQVIQEGGGAKDDM